MTQFLHQLKSIKTEAQLFESMRKVRLKPIVFPRVGRPPKSILGLENPARTLMTMTRRPKPAPILQKRLLGLERKDRTGDRQPTTARPTTKLISLVPGQTVLSSDEGEKEDEDDPIEYHLRRLEEDTDQPTTTLAFDFVSFP